MKLGLSMFRRAPVAAVTAVTVVTALVLVPVTDASAVTVTNLVNQSFTASTVPNEWYLPPAPSGQGTNDTCLTAATVSAQLPIPGCTPLIGDASGSGTLRLTPALGSKVGSAFYQTSLPTSAGLDIKFDTYQYGATSASGADGIGFALTAVDPANPAPPSATGPVGGSLGYSATGTSASGIPFGYLGYGADAWGNFANSTFGGSGCTLPAGLTAGSAYPENLTVRGPGTGTTGYCILGTTATTYRNGNAGGSGGTVSNLGGQYLDVKSATTRPTPVAAEIAMNPTSSAASTASGISVPANSYLIKVTPYSNATGGAIGTAKTLTGPLPTTISGSAGYNAVLASSSNFDQSWINPATGVPYQVSFGWVASTGGSTEIHEVANLVATTLSGQLPVLSLGMTDNESGKFLTGNHADITLSPTVSATGGDEVDPITVTDTFPAGITPGTATSSSLWTCTTSGQTVKCTYAPASPIAAGTALPTIDVPVTTGATAGTLTNTARMGSIDGAPDATTSYYTLSTFAATATPASTTYGAPATLAYTGLPANATGTVTYTSGATAICTVTLGSATSCTSPTTLAPGTYSTTATYSGDGSYQSTTATTSFVVNKASTAITASAAPSSTTYGNAVALTAGNVPTAASGSITFAAGGTTLCTATLPTLTCSTSSTLALGTYSVTATYAGDANYTGSTATTSFTVAVAPTTFSAAATPPTVAYGTATSLSETGLPTLATGTVVFKTGTTTICTATLPTTSCGSLTSQAPGTVNVTATYSGDTHYSSSTATTAYLVTKASTTLTASVSSAGVPYETADTLSWGGLPSGAGGSVVFKSAGTTLCTATLPSTGCSSPTSLVVGTYPVTATYSGDANYSASSASTTFDVTKEASPFTASATPGTVAYGTAVSLAEAGLLSGATGTVTFVSGGVTLCTITRGTGTSCSTPANLDPGTYPVTVTYSGDANHASSSATTTFTVTKATSTFTVAASPSSTGFGNSVTLTETGLAAGSTGTVVYKAGTTTLCTETLSALSCGTLTSLPAGAYSVTATYSGDTYHASATATTSFTITSVASSFTASATPSSVTYGTAVALDVHGLQGGATGSVTYASGGTTLCTATLPTTGCSTTATLAVGSYPVTATYAGDGSVNGSSATTSFSVTKIPTAVAAAVTPASVEYQTATTLKESGLPAGATGTVTFTTGATTLCTVTLGSATSCSTPTSLAVGSYSVTATYSGDAHHLGSTDTTSFAVTKESTSLTAAAAPASVTYGDPVTLGATGLVAGATGTVTFTAGGTTLCTVSVGSTISCATSSTLNPGHYAVTATYSGDANHLGASDTTSFDVTKASTTVVAGASPSSVGFGNAVTLTGTGLPATATGTLTFVSDSTALCSVDLSDGHSCLTTTTLDAATYPVTLTYSGDSHYAGSSDTTSFDVTPLSTNLAVGTAPAVVAWGNGVTLSEGGLPVGATGTVTYTSGSTALCTVTLGSATSCSTPTNLEPGSYPVTGTYSGDTDHTGSSATTTFTVTKAPTSLAAAVTPGTVTYGTAVALKQSGLPASATGTVTFTSGGATLCTVALGGPSTCSTSSTLTAGDYPVTATYSGDAHFAGSTDSVTFHVTKASSAITASAAPHSVAYGTAVTLTAGGLPAGADGKVVFSSGGTTLCSATLPALSCATSSTLVAGSYPVDAVWSGDADHTGSSATTSFVVAPASTALSVGASPSTTPYGNPVTLTTSGLPAAATGLVTFTAGSATLCTVDVATASTCTTPATLNPGSYAVTGTYSGDQNYAGSSDTTGFSVIKVSTSLSAAATPSSVSYGTAVTLSAGNLPAGAVGTVTFTRGGTTLCTVDLSVATSCSTSSTLAVGSYAVTATYSGDVAHTGSTATTSFIVGTAATTLHAGAAPASVAYGNVVTLTEGGLPTGATGTVTFTTGATVLCVVDVATASSCGAPDDLSPGSYPVTATYSGDSRFAGSTATTAFSVTVAASAVTGSGPAHTTYGTPVTLSIGGLAADATGVVTLRTGTTVLCTITLPATSCVVGPTLAPGSYPVTVSYGGDGNYAASTDSFSTAVDKAPTTVSGSSTPSSVQYGDPVTLTPGGLPAGATGTVTFSSNGTTLCTVTLPAQTSCQTSTSLPAASYPVDVTYSGDGNYLSSTDTSSFTIGAAATTFAVNATPSTVPYGTAVTLTPAGLPSGATGTVTMTSGGTTLCTVALGTGTSCQPSSGTAVGHYPVTASYSGDSNWSASSAGTVFDVIAAAAPFTASATPGTAPYGTVVTLSDSGLPAAATGVVSFRQGAVVYCTATLPATSCSTGANLDPAVYPITADYSGDGSFDASSATTSFTVVKAPSSLTATATPGTTTYGSPVTLTAAGLPQDADGTVTFISGSTTLCTVDLALATSCIAPVGLLPAGYPVSATYSGDVDHLGSSDTTSFTVTHAPTAVMAGATPGSVSYGTPVTLTDGNLPTGATGTVTFTSGSTTLCTVDVAVASSCTTSATLAAGSYPVTATYSGDGSWSGSTDTTTFSVNPASVGLGAAAVPSTVSYGHAVLLVASGLPAGATGSVVFSTGGTAICTVTLPQTSCSTGAALDPGTYPVDAVYSGDSNHAGATANTSFTVTKAPVTITAAASPTTTPYGQQVTLSVAGLPTGASGTVVFSSGGNVLCTVTLPATSCGAPADLAPGTYGVDAVYSGDVDHAAAGATTSFTVVHAGSTLTASANPSAVPHGTATTLGFAGLPTDATGTVTFSSGGVVLCTVTLGSGQGCATSATLGTGDYAVVATYSGDGRYATATATTGFSVGPVAATLTTTGPVGKPQQTVVDKPATATITLLDDKGNTVLKVVEPGQGTYVLDPRTGVITFTPVATFAGNATAVRYRITVASGQSDTGTYRAHVVAPKPPHPADRSTTGPVDSAQHTNVTVPHGDTIRLLDTHGKPVTHVEITGKGTYTLDASTGRITFLPVKGWTGAVDGVRFAVTDVFGQRGTAVYSATVTGGTTPPPPVHGTPPPPVPMPEPGTLPFTGFDAERMLLVTTFMVSAGVILVLAGRRRVTSSSSARD